jgi:hypothetical protein
MEEQLKQEQQKLNEMIGNIEAGRKQLTAMEHAAYQTQGRVAILTELVADQKKEPSE